MKTSRLPLLVILIIGSLSGCEKPDCGCAPPPSPLAGDWQLVRINYAMTQQTVTATQAGYSEKLSFGGSVEGGSFTQTRNGVVLTSGPYSLAFPNGGTTEGRILYELPNQRERMEQSFELDRNYKRLILTERKPVTVALADGATYEYERQ